MSVRNDQRLRYPLGVVALVVGIFLLEGALRAVLGPAASAGGGFPAWLPTAGTVGETVTAYALLGNAYAYLLVPAAAFWLGIRYGRGE